MSATADTSDDARRLPADVGEPGVFPAETPRMGDPFVAVARRSAVNAIRRHAQAHPDKEICGVLLGKLRRDDTGPFLQIDAAVEGRHADNQASGVTFTAETWAYVQDVMERDHPDLVMVGWYHSHPDFGSFLSDWDLFIQRNFFDAAWQVAWVYDPVRRDEALFYWRDDAMERDFFAVDEDTENTAPGPEDENPIPGYLGAPPGFAAVHNEIMDDFKTKLRRIGRAYRYRMGAMYAGIAGLLSVALLGVALLRRYRYGDGYPAVDQLGAMGGLTLALLLVALFCWRRRDAALDREDGDAPDEGREEGDGDGGR